MRDRILAAAAAVTHPMVPDNVINLVNPLWSSRETRARVEAVRRETRDAATLVLRPGRAVPMHLAGQHVRVGVDIDGVRHWRTYSVTSPSGRSDGTLEITVKAIAGGLVSNHLVHGTNTGDIIRIEGPQGDFVLPQDQPIRALFVTAGSGITPVMGMLRTVEQQQLETDLVMVHSALTADDVIFGAELRSLAGQRIRLHEQHTDTMGMLTFDRIAEICPDWRERDVWVCGPAAMLDAATDFWTAAGLLDRLHLERFTAFSYETSDSAQAEVTFGRSGKTATTDGGQTLLDLGEQAGVLMPSGCRMGICFSCVIPLQEGRIRDVRTGEIHGEPGDLVQTCISTPCTDTVLDV